MISVATSSASISTSSSSYSNKERRVSSGRGGSGNIVYSSELVSDLQHEAEVLLIRRIEKEKEIFVKKKINTGRGGNGNIVAASAAQSVPFDKSTDPDDSYEEIVTEQNKKAQKVSSTGRGGVGNLSGVKKKENRPRSNSIPESLSSTSTSPRRSRLSRISSPSSSLPSSPQADQSTFQLGQGSPIPASNSTSFCIPLAPKPSEPQESPTQDSPGADATINGDSRKKPRWWKFGRQRDDNTQQQDVTAPKRPLSSVVLDIGTLKEEEEDIDRPENNLRIRRQVYLMDRSHIELEYSIEHYTPGGEQGQQALNNAGDSGKDEDYDDDDASWQLEVLQEAVENEIDSFLDL